MDLPLWANELCVDTMQSRRPVKSDEWFGQMAKESWNAMRSVQLDDEIYMPTLSTMKDKINSITPSGTFDLEYIWYTYQWY